MDKVIYTLDGHYFQDFGIFVSKSKGFGLPPRKEPNAYTWADTNGISVDLSSPRYQERTIELDCFIIASGWKDLYRQYSEFMKILDGAGTHRLEVEFAGKVLAFEVYRSGEAKFEKDLKIGQIAGSFNLKLIEPNPIKIVLKSTTPSLDLQFRTEKPAEIFYGDGTKDEVRGDVRLSGRDFKPKKIKRFAPENYLANRMITYDLADNGGFLFTSTGTEDSIFLGHIPHRGKWKLQIEIIQDKGQTHTSSLRIGDTTHALQLYSYWNRYDIEQDVEEYASIDILDLPAGTYRLKNLSLTQPQPWGDIPRNLYSRDTPKHGLYGLNTPTPISKGFTFDGKTGGFLLIDRLINDPGDYVMSLDVKSSKPSAGFTIWGAGHKVGRVQATQKTTHFEFPFTVKNVAHDRTSINIIEMDEARFYLTNIQLVKGKPMPYRPAPEDTNYILIAGDPEGITRLISNAPSL